MWFLPNPDLPREVMFVASMTIITTAILWLIVADYRRARAAHNRTLEWIYLTIIFLINAVIGAILVYYRRELVSFLKSALFSH